MFKKEFKLGISINFPAMGMLEGCDISHVKGVIHISVWSTKTFLYDIREPRYEQIKIGYQIAKTLCIG